MSEDRIKQLEDKLTKFLRLGELHYLVLASDVSRFQPELDLLIKESKELLNQE